MILLDNHVHTTFSSDGKDTMESVIKRGINIGVKHLTFTDHLEYNPDGFSLNCEEYIKAIMEFKEKYKKNIDILAGVEVGYQSHLNKKIENILASNPFDFVLCSTHSVDEISVSGPRYFKGLSKQEAYTKYFETMLKTVKEFKNFDSYGHLDYIIRYGGYEESKVIYKDYKDVLDSVLSTIIASGNGIEINTSGYRYGMNAMHPNIEILKRYKELGGEVITVGSDSHRAIDLCADFDEAFQILNHIGFTYVCKFKDRKPEFIPLEKERKVFIA